MIKLKINLDLFHDARLLKGFSVSQVAEQAGISKQALYQIINNKTGASPKTAKALTEVLNVDFKELFTRV